MSGTQSPLSIVGDDSFPSEEMSILMQADPYQCRELATRSSLSLNAVQQLYPKFPQELLDSGVLAELTRTNDKAAQKIFEDHSQIIRELRIDEEWAQYFINSSPKLIAEVAANPLLPIIYWNYCCNHYLVEIRRSIAMNSATDYATVATLSGDSDLMVRRLAEGQMQSRFPAAKMATPNESPAGIQQDVPKAPESNANAIKDGNIQVTLNPSHLIITALSLALLMSLGALLMRQPQQSANTPTLAGTSGGAKALKNTAEDSNFALAIEEANEASALARTSPEAKSGLANIVSHWDKAIALLEKVGKDESEFAKAQKKIRSYKIIRSVANGNLEKAK